MTGVSSRSVTSGSVVSSPPAHAVSPTAIARALEATGGHRSQTAELLGISRKTLWEKVKHYGITIDR